MRCDLIYPVKNQVVLHDDQEECIAPVPGVVFDDSVCIHLDPQVKKYKGPAEDPAKDVHEYGVIGREV